MKKYAFLAVIAILLLALAAYFYASAPTKGPSLPTPTQPTETTSAPNRYVIASERSVATFSIFEMLRGEPVTVIGTSTGMVSGEFTIDRANLASSTIGTIKLNARNFVTDNDSRNNAIRRMVLKTEVDANEFITFVPTSISGATTSLRIAGNLTVSGVTKPATFDASVSFDGTGSALINATGKIKRSDFTIVIPSLPFLADVADEVGLSLHLVATP